jgi:hypothetical protein
LYIHIFYRLRLDKNKPKKLAENKNAKPGVGIAFASVSIVIGV